MGQTGEKQQRRTVHGQPAGRHGRAPVAEAMHDQHGRSCVLARSCVGACFRDKKAFSAGFPGGHTEVAWNISLVIFKVIYVRFQQIRRISLGLKIVILDSIFGFQVPSINSRLSFIPFSLFISLLFLFMFCQFDSCICFVQFICLVFVVNSCYLVVQIHFISFSLFCSLSLCSCLLVQVFMCL